MLAVSEGRLRSGRKRILQGTVRLEFLRTVLSRFVAVYSTGQIWAPWLYDASPAGRLAQYLKNPVPYSRVPDFTSEPSPSSTRNRPSFSNLRLLDPACDNLNVHRDDFVTSGFFPVIACPLFHAESRRQQANSRAQLCANVFSSGERITAGLILLQGAAPCPLRLPLWKLLSFRRIDWSLKTYFLLSVECLFSAARYFDHCFYSGGLFALKMFAQKNYSENSAHRPHWELCDFSKTRLCWHPCVTKWWMVD